MLEPGPRIGENPTGAPAPVVARLFAGCAENPAMPPGAVSVAPSQIATPPSAVPTPVELTCTGTPYTNVCPASSTIASIGKDTAPPKSQFGSIASAKFAMISPYYFGTRATEAFPPSPVVARLRI